MKKTVYYREKHRRIQENTYKGREKGRLTVEKYVRDMKKFYEYAKGKCIQ
ncbi:MAG: hypothetical protein V8S21_01360 [Lachnospira eligens]